MTASKRKRKLISTAEIHREEARLRGGKIVSGDRAFITRSIAAKTVRNIVAREAAARRGKLVKGDKAAKAQSRAAHEPRFPLGW